MKVEARYYEKKDGAIQCRLCPHLCLIQSGQSGSCRARLNEDGKLWAINYAETTSVALDPIEKKPLYHFHPGQPILSIACNSCNMRCPFCQNWEISQKASGTQPMPPEILVKVFQDHKSLGVSYTYTEPMVWFEYIMDAAKLIRKHGGKNVLVTNGLINEEPLREMLPLIDAMNIDLKSMDPKKYAKVLYGDLDAVKRTIEVSRTQCHVEVTNLIVSGLNDKEPQVDQLIDYVASLDKNLPLHFSRYFPNYNYKKPPTSESALENAYEKARQKLNYVYLGNMPAEEAANTYCPKCRNLLIERMHFRAIIKGLKEKQCARCGETIPIVL